MAQGLCRAYLAAALLAAAATPAFAASGTPLNRSGAKNGATPTMSTGAIAPEEVGGAGGTPATVKLGAATGAEVAVFAPGVGLDWWVESDGTYGFQWGNASILTLDLTDPGLIALASGLSPSLLRIGGSPSDSIQYEVPGTEACARGSGTPGGSAQFTCSQTGKSAYGCLTGDRWREILKFAKTTGLFIAFGLNACNGRTSADSPMDFSNIEALINFTLSLPEGEDSQLVAFEFGNEVLGHGVSPTQWAKDANALDTLIKTMYAKGGQTRPALVGPDHYSTDGYSTVLENLSPGTLYAVTYHNYPQCDPANAKPGMVNSPDCFAKVDAAAEHTAGIVTAAGYAAQVWMGEGAMTTAHGADYGRSFLPTFQSSFYYAYITAALPLNGVALGARQTLVGGNYGLLNKTTLTPQPDYFVTWIYRRLFGVLRVGRTHALNLTSSVDPLVDGLKAFAFASDVTDGAGRRGSRPAISRLPQVLCGIDGIEATKVVVLINLAKDTSFDVTISSEGDSVQRAHPSQHRRAGMGADAPQYEWHLEGIPTYTAEAITINGEAMTYPGDGPGGLWDLGTLARNTTVGTPVTVSPASIVFVAL
eukprot:m.19170 g.19170  ORF g.19170 m.19170 type:complete len:591 (-) comp5408_c0_seq1:944-2716(-)